MQCDVACRGGEERGPRGGRTSPFVPSLGRRSGHQCIYTYVV